MKAIRVSFRAVFRQPIGVLNPMGAKLLVPISIEIFGTGEKWQAREINSARKQIFTKLPAFANPSSGQKIVEQAFAEQLQAWQIWGIPPDCEHVVHERMLSPDEVCDLGDGKWGWYTAEDRTHIIHAPTIPPGARIPPAACGAKLDAKHFISTKANLEPTCKVCAEVYRKEYAAK